MSTEVNDAKLAMTPPNADDDVDLALCRSFSQISNVSDSEDLELRRSMSQVSTMSLSSPRANANANKRDSSHANALNGLNGLHTTDQCQSQSVNLPNIDFDLLDTRPESLVLLGPLPSLPMPSLPHMTQTSSTLPSMPVLSSMPSFTEQAHIPQLQSQFSFDFSRPLLSEACTSDTVADLISAQPMSPESKDKDKAKDMDTNMEQTKMVFVKNEASTATARIDTGAESKTLEPIQHMITVKREPNTDSVTVKVEQREMEQKKLHQPRARTQSRKNTNNKSKSRSKKGKNVKVESNDDDVVSIGIYTKAERRRKIARFREKWLKAFPDWQPGKKRVITYEVRKKFAQTRQRVGGRFLKGSPALWNKEKEKAAISGQSIADAVCGTTSKPQAQTQRRSSSPVPMPTRPASTRKRTPTIKTQQTQQTPLSLSLDNTSGNTGDQYQHESKSKSNFNFRTVPMSISPPDTPIHQPTRMMTSPSLEMLPVLSLVSVATALTAAAAAASSAALGLTAVGSLQSFAMATE